MNLRIALPSLLATVLAVGCAPYRGAVYSEYTQIGLDVRANSASSTPILGTVGYDHAIGAYVPRRNSGTNGSYGESVSVIAWNYTGTKMNPLAPTNSALSMDAGFISGTAAGVAAAPANAVVSVVGIAWETNASVTTVGTAGERIAAASAFAPATIRPLPTELQARRVALALKLASFQGDAAKLNRILTAAGFAMVPADQAVRTLQVRILEAQTEADVKKLEDAFNTAR